MDTFIDYWVKKSKPYLKLKDEVKGSILKFRVVTMKHPKGYVKELAVAYSGGSIVSLVDSGDSYLIGEPGEANDKVYELVDKLSVVYSDSAEWKRKAINLDTLNLSETNSFGALKDVIRNVAKVNTDKIHVYEVKFAQGGLIEIYLADINEILIPVTLILSMSIKNTIVVKFYGKDYKSIRDEVDAFLEELSKSLDFVTRYEVMM